MAGRFANLAFHDVEQCLLRSHVRPPARPAFPAPVCPRASASSYPTPVRALTSHPCAHPHARFLALCLLSGVCLDGNLLGRCRKKRCDSGTTAHGVYARFVLGKARLCDRDGKQSLGSGVRWGGAWLARGGMQVAGARCLGWFWHAVCGWGAARARMARRLRGRAVRVLPGSACVGGIRAGRLPTALGSRGTASFLAFADAFLQMFHVKHLFRHRTTLRQLFHVKHCASAPLNLVRPRNPGTPEPRNPGTPEPRNPGTPEPRNPGTPEPRNPGTRNPNPGTPEPRNPGTPEPRNPSFGSLCAKRGRVFPAPRMTPPSVVLRFLPSSPSPAALSSRSHPRFPLPCPRCTPPRLLPHPVVRLSDSSSLRASRPLALSASPVPPHRPPAPPHAPRPRIPPQRRTPAPRAPRSARPAPPASPRTPRRTLRAPRPRPRARGNSTQNGYAQVGGFRLVSMSSVSPIGEVCSKRAGRFS